MRTYHREGETEERTLPKNWSKISTYRWMISRVINSLSSYPIWQMKKSDA